MSREDSYERDVILEGDKGSREFATTYAQTLQQKGIVEHIENIGDQNFVRIPEGQWGIAFSSTGNPNQIRPFEHAETLAVKLQLTAMSMRTEHFPRGVKPIVMANVVDAHSADPDVRKQIESALIGRALPSRPRQDNGVEHPVFGIIGGEYAILGDRITLQYQISMNGLMLASISPDHLKELTGRKVTRAVDNGEVVREKIGVHDVIVFNPGNRLVSMGSDGTGTKLELYSRLAQHIQNPAIYGRGADDSAAMLLDDASKSAAQALAIFNHVETTGDSKSDIERVLSERAEDIGRQLGFYFINRFNESDRIVGWDPGCPDYNISGSLLSLVDLELLAKLGPRAGQKLVAVTNKVRSPRSNGITELREVLEQHYGHLWHEKDIGAVVGNYLTTPSTILYGLFRSLLLDGTATAVFHNSGGAYNGKLARPLAVADLHVTLDMNDMFPAPAEALLLAGLRLNDARSAYGKWPMGTEGFVATNDPENVQAFVAKYHPDLESRVVGTLERASRGQTGVTLDFGPDKKVYFSGVDDAA
ncbi:hypothetical protein JW868_04095 [Candidatus Woesearchaeota archaeon]|nr:hypothetical protein [Candidatus Woesearchaeota archaeon]